MNYRKVPLLPFLMRLSVIQVRIDEMKKCQSMLHNHFGEVQLGIHTQQLLLTDLRLVFVDQQQTTLIVSRWLLNILETLEIQSLQILCSFCASGPVTLNKQRSLSPKHQLLNLSGPVYHISSSSNKNQQSTVNSHHSPKWLCATHS